MVLSITEGLNLDAFDAQTAPTVYLNGTVLFVVGLAIIQGHNIWRWNWTTLVTLTGWGALLVGLSRMALPRLDQLAPGPSAYVALSVLFLLGLVLSAAAWASRCGLINR